MNKYVNFILLMNAAHTLFIKDLYNIGGIILIQHMNDYR